MNEAQIINQTFRDMKVLARTRRGVGTPSFLLFGIEKQAGEKITNVLGARDELSLRLTNLRSEPTVVRFHDLPLMLEVPRQKPRIKQYQPIELDPGQMRVGVGYSLAGPQQQIVDLSSSPHTLIAAQTNGGKSVLMRAALLTLLDNASPDRLQVSLIDMKNRALAPFATLPHVQHFATCDTDATDTLRFALDELHRRKAHPATYSPYVIFIDELAQLSETARAPIAELLALGRELRIHVISATQHPTAKLLGGSETLVNYTTRLVGHVASAQVAAIVAGRPATGAEFLPPGNGSFLLVEGPTVARFQTCYLNDATLQKHISTIAARHPAAESPQTAQEPHHSLIAVFEEYYDDNENLKRGGMNEAIRALYGKSAVTAGGRQRQQQREQVMNALNQWLASRPASRPATEILPSRPVRGHVPGLSSGLPTSVNLGKVRMRKEMREN